MAKEFMEALKERRSYYAISKESHVSDARIEEIIGEAVKYTPSSFNSQSARVVVLLGEKHDKLWNITEETLRKTVNDEEKFKSTADKMASFRAGYGTVLFFEDQEVIENLQKQFALYADNFPVWANQSSGMLQLVVWTALKQEGLGASLQHYNPLIDDEVKEVFDVPATWKLIAQMPFGAPAADPGDKDFAPLDTRLKVLK
ncbi:nitroreductase family protein [Paenibacillus urinalis]|uniref:Nitroreductase family protein n=1 Tax=Paenibacillus urinalis TaxID=521520 RepID=A0AAX3N446_9BACL|nr:MULTISPECIES: nitroreductase family protein [Paenibacillus]WDH84621.1 nitroreductase family protein [Paenibacillus urinalis]WDH96083.1 nitroreductase family protein [Paenibacillus urinalis]WDI04304.1 nitroreductase family protein [Paenibacillus urinalis]GAK38364.1 putative nitroreductase [Paenibacillus sp. TCA20]